MSTTTECIAKVDVSPIYSRSIADYPTHLRAWADHAHDLIPEADVLEIYWGGGLIARIGLRTSSG